MTKCYIPTMNTPKMTKPKTTTMWEQIAAKGTPTVKDPLTDEMKKQGVRMSSEFVPDGPSLEEWREIGNKTLVELWAEIEAADKRMKAVGDENERLRSSLRLKIETVVRLQKIKNEVVKEAREWKRQRDEMKEQRNQARIQAKELQEAFDRADTITKQCLSKSQDAVSKAKNMAALKEAAFLQTHRTEKELWCWQIATVLLFLALVATFYMFLFHESDLPEMRGTGKDPVEKREHQLVEPNGDVPDVLGKAGD